MQTTCLLYQPSAPNAQKQTVTAALLTTQQHTTRHAGQLFTLGTAHTCSQVKMASTTVQCSKQLKSVSESDHVNQGMQHSAPDMRHLSCTSVCTCFYSKLCVAPRRAPVKTGRKTVTTKKQHAAAP
jgi:hypothetical protein